jgi:collagen type III alpha
MMTQQQMAQIQQQQYRQSMHHLHKTNLMAGNAASPTSGDFNGNGSQGRGPQFAGNGAPDHRTNQNKSMGMLPPPSPAGALKDQSGQNKDKGGPSTSSNRSEGSPRNQHPNPGQGTSNAGNSGQSSTAPPTPNNVMTAPSPSAILVNTPTGMNPPGQPMAAPPSDISAIFGNADFISSMGPLPMIDGFDDATLSKSFDVDFERDFGQWFNPENDVTGALDPK